MHTDKFLYSISSSANDASNSSAYYLYRCNVASINLASNQIVYTIYQIVYYYIPDSLLLYYFDKLILLYCFDNLLNKYVLYYRRAATAPS